MKIHAMYSSRILPALTLVAMMAFSSCRRSEEVHTTIPEGVTIAQGKARAEPGFKFVKGGANTVLLQRNNGNITTGKFACGCPTAQCTVISDDVQLKCAGPACCLLVVITKPPPPPGGNGC